MQTNIILLLSILFIFLTKNGLSQQKMPDLTDLEHYIEEARLQWKVPGMSVTIVKNGDVILSKGFGVSSIESNQKVDDQTLFMLGSTTKAMTAAAMAMLVDEGRLSWSDKVTDHLSWFKLSNPYITRELTIKDLFTHNTGLGNSDLLWVLWDYSTEEIVRRLSKQPMSYSLRGGYTYQNIMYATAGLIIEKHSGQTWDSFIHERIFAPLNMTRSCAVKACAETYNNRAKPHYNTEDRRIIEIIDSNADSIASAGSAWSCSSDIAKWTQFVLDSAVVGGKRLISIENFTYLNTPHIIIPKRNFYPTTQLTKPHFTAYSLGWFIHDYEGEYIQFHTGSLNGSGAIIGLMPDHDLGVYVMVNLENAEVRHAIMYKVFDYFLNLGNRDWSTDIKELYAERAKGRNEARSKMLSSKVNNTNSDIAETEIIGKYHNEFLGMLLVDKYKDGYRITSRKDRHIVLNHFHYNTFFGKIEEYPHEFGDLVDFDRSATGQISFSLYGHEFAKN